MKGYSTERRWWFAGMRWVGLLGLVGLMTSAGLAREAPGRTDGERTAERREGSQTRIWKDRTGKYSVEAELLEMEDDRVRLRKAGGVIVSVALERLSQSDREYIERAVQERAASDRVVVVEYMPPPPVVDKKVYDALQESASLSFRNIGPTELAEVLQAELELPVVVRGNIDEGATLSVQEQDVPLDTALNRVFEGTQLGYVVTEGALVILPRADVERQLIERTYAVADIAASAADLQDLAAALMTACRPESWSYIGGPGELLPIDEPPRLQIRQSFDAHQEVVRFLRACKELRMAIAEESSLGFLVEALSSDEEMRCAAACYTLGRLGPRAKPAVPRLVELMGDPRAQLAALAVNTLGRIGQAALPELTAAATGDDPALARRAEAAIGQIGSSGNRRSARR